MPRWSRQESVRIYSGYVMIGFDELRPSATDEKRYCRMAGSAHAYMLANTISLRRWAVTPQRQDIGPAARPPSGRKTQAAWVFVALSGGNTSPTSARPP